MRAKREGKKKKNQMKNIGKDKIQRKRKSERDGYNQKNKIK